MKGGKPEDLTGFQFGRLTVLSITRHSNGRPASLCRCDCGMEKVILNQSLRKGLTLSCGCMQKELARLKWLDKEGRRAVGADRVTHGLSNHKDYQCYKDMLNRCYREKTDSYPLYGGKGIRVCDRWRDSLTGFKNFLEDMGERPKGWTLDRKDSSKDYSPENCRWATKVQQGQNVGKKNRHEHGFKGCYKNGGGWNSHIRSNHQAYPLGYYKTQQEAAYAYDVASEILHGEFGVRNGVVPPPDAENVKKRVIDKINQRRAAQTQE